MSRFSVKRDKFRNKLRRLWRWRDFVVENIFFEILTHHSFDKFFLKQHHRSRTRSKRNLDDDISALFFFKKSINLFIIAWNLK